MDHALARELESWADRLGWRWFHTPGVPQVGSSLLDAEKREMGQVSTHLGDPWGWVLEAGDGVVREGSSPTGRVAKGGLLAEALLWVFVNRLEGWRVFRSETGETVVYKTRDTDGEEEPMADCWPSSGTPNWRVRCTAEENGDWAIEGGFDSEGGHHDGRLALADMVCRTMRMLVRFALVPGGEGEPDPPDDGEIDREQLARTRRALEGFE